MSSPTGPRPRVTVIIPVKDRKELLARCLDGLRRQRFRDFEVVVGDDGSTDGSPGAVVDAAARGLPARWVASPGRGAVDARIAAIDVALGEVLAFTDSDCVPDPAWLEALVTAMDAGADIVQGRTEPERPMRLNERSMAVLQADPRYPTCNMAYRRSAYDSVGGFDRNAMAAFGFRPGGRIAGLDFGVDSLLAWRAIRAGKLAAFAPQAVVRHAVFSYNRGESIRRAWLGGAFPGVLREMPELAELLRWGFVYGSIDKLPLYPLMIAALARKPRLSATFAVAWVGLAARRLHKFGASWGEVPVLLPEAVVVEAVRVAALVLGSVKARRLVL